MQEQSFFSWCAVSVWTRLNKIWPKWKIFHYVALKKLVFLPLFQTSSPFSRLFPGLENCWANFKTFSRTKGSPIGRIFHSTGYRVRTLYWTKNSRTFQVLPIFKDSIQYEKSLDYMFFLDLLQQEQSYSKGLSVFAPLRYLTGAPNVNIVENHLNIALLNVF